MRRGTWIVRPMVGAALTLLVGCSGGVAPGPGLPTFPNSAGPSSSGAAAVQDVGVVPDDCARVLPTSELVAVLGLPLDSVAVRTILGVPTPSVGRVERIDCAYSGTPVSGRDSGKALLAVNAAAYDSPADARAQWRFNASAEDGAHRDLPVGIASGVLVERAGEALLTVLYGSGTVTLTLPARPLPGGKTPDVMLVDLARRVLPTMVGAAPRVTTASITTAPFAPTSIPPAAVPPSGSVRAVERPDLRVR